MRRERGFTLIEMLIVVAIMAVLATAAYTTSRTAVRDANVGSAAFNLAARMSGLAARAMSENVDYLVVVQNAPNSGADSIDCGWWQPSKCTQYFVFKDALPACPAAAPCFDITTFSPAALGAVTNATGEVDTYYMPKGVQFYNAVTATPPVPLQNSVVLTTPARQTFGIRFRQDGMVLLEGPAFVPVGGAMLFGGETGNQGMVKGVVVSFPSGIVKTFSSS